LFGAGLACYWPSMIAWLGENLSGPALVRRLAAFGVAWNVGLLLGFGSSGMLFQHGPRLAFYFSAGAILAIIGLLLLTSWLPPVGPNVGPTTAARPEAHSRVVHGVAPDQPVLPIPAGRGFRKTAWVASFAVNFAFAGTTALFPELATHLHID